MPPRLSADLSADRFVCRWWYCETVAGEQWRTTTARLESAQERWLPPPFLCVDEARIFFCEKGEIFILHKFLLLEPCLWYLKSGDYSSLKNHFSRCGKVQRFRTFHTLNGLSPTFPTPFLHSWDGSWQLFHLGSLKFFNGHSCLFESCRVQQKRYRSPPNPVQVST